MTSTGYVRFNIGLKDFTRSRLSSSVRRFYKTTFLLGLLTFLPLGFMAQSAHARDLQGRLGLGFNDEFANQGLANGVPAISLKYGISRDIATEAVLGVNTGNPSNSVAALKFFRNLFYETNLNFYFTAGAGIVTANNKTGAEILSGFGAEAFIPGIESLGFSMEVGATLDNLAGNFVLKTLGVSFLNAGIHFYF
jgi:hypothetical protein